MKKLMTFILGLLICSPGFAQENKDNEFAIGAQLRSRAEYRDGALSPHPDGSDPAAFINYRARLSMDYKRDKLALGFSAQQVGVFGQYAQVDKGGRMMMNEAWANFTPGGGFFLKLGRQILSYDDDRILGSLDWNVAGRSHDAIKFGFENKQNKFHAIFAFNQNDEYPTGNFYAGGGQPYKTMQTLWYQYLASSKFNFSLLAMNLGLQSGTATESSVKSMQTFGANLSYQPLTPLQLYGTFYLQSGKTVADQSISAFMWALNASYSVNPAFKIMAASDYLSGNDGKDAGKYKAFNPLYGTHHKFYGTMDYFYASNFINGLNPGLWDNQLGASYKVAPKVTLALNYHHFSINTDMNDAAGEKLSKALGSEWDFQVTWNVMKDVGFTGGYSNMFGNDTMKAVKGGEPSKSQQWMWVSLNINPKVLITKW